MTERDDSVFIGHILESIKAIEEFSKNITQEELHTNRLKKSAIVREIEIIGEASKNLTPEFRKNKIKLFGEKLLEQETLWFINILELT